MIVRIRLRRGRPFEQKRGKNRNLALACGALLGPAALMAYVLGGWSLASDMGLARAFAISGLFSHWQVWIAVAVALQVGASALSRYGHGVDVHLPEVLDFNKMFPSRAPAQMTDTDQETSDSHPAQR